jgi:hypothetical protein
MFQDGGLLGYSRLLEEGIHAWWSCWGVNQGPWPLGLRRRRIKKKCWGGGKGREEGGEPGRANSAVQMGLMSVGFALAAAVSLRAR